MAKSRRNQVVSESALAQGSQRFAQRKQKKADIMAQVQACLMNGGFSHFYVFRVHNMRAALFQRLRLDVTEHTRLFFSKNRLLAAAFKERADVEDIKKTLNGPLLGIAFTKAPAAFEDYTQHGSVIGIPEYAKTGTPAPETIVLPAGTLCRLDDGLPVSPTLESHVRTECGLPTTLRNGNILLSDPQTVCDAGQPLSARAVKLLRVLGKPLAAFCVELLSRYSI